MLCQIINRRKEETALPLPVRILLIVLAVLVVLMVVLYFVGKKLEKKQSQQREMIESSKQQLTMLIIDKKRMPLRDAGLPAAVMEQVPKRFQRHKMPIVKVRAAGRVMNLIAEEKIFDIIPTGKEVKATIAGIYLLDVKAIRGQLEAPAKKKGGLRAKLLAAREKAAAEATGNEKKKK